jgi:hypothetical protein
MRKEPCVALTVVNVYFVVGIFSVAMNDVFAVECVVRLKWFLDSKAISIDVSDSW